jgi:hypothetical protein
VYEIFRGNHEIEIYRERAERTSSPYNGLQSFTLEMADAKPPRRTIKRAKTATSRAPTERWVSAERLIARIEAL